MKPLRILHVVASVDEEAAGPSVSVPRLAEAQARAGLDVEIATVEGVDKNLAPLRTFKGVHHERYPRSLARVPLISRLALSAPLRHVLIQRADEFDIIHGHGLWLMPNVYPAAAARAGGARYVLAPRGMLGADALRFSAFRKRMFWCLAQRRAVQAAAMIHATSEAEVADARNFGLRQPAVLAPNGVDVIEFVGPRSAPYDGVKTILSLGRIHPKKGLESLIRAFATLEARHPNWRLRIIGPSEGGHAHKLHRLAGELGCKRITIEGPVYGKDKAAAYRAADLFALPTLHENFAMTVAEALAAGTPVVSTIGAPWAGLDREGCGLWIDHGVEPMAAALDRLMILDPTRLAQMGIRGRAWVKREFSWDHAAQELTKAYEWLIEGGKRPSCLHLPLCCGRPKITHSFSQSLD